ncbi:nuclease-related domain-containing protein [Mesobacillus foraminis]|uniref:Nuclease-like protein n=1 Tax=Mesobacillus foraminis TaxID=279826 RepID=A0A4R2BHG7_9BACI|nr:nuclease-related domain-containing protein [Mesobacillus foraminis]TCN26538.1 nuclease-like protein [Mesobacillus foraminis]
MIIKPLQIPMILESLEALKNRLMTDHPKTTVVQAEWAKRNAGYIGEKNVYYFLSTLEETSYLIFHDLRLANGEHFFQIDFLILTSRFALIIETKNISGTLLFDDQGQLIRTMNNKEEGFPDPIAQAQYHKRSLQKWLDAHHFPPLPIDYVVVISQPSSIIKVERNQPEIRRRIQPVSSLPEFIQRLENLCKQDQLDAKTLKKLSKLFLKLHCPIQIDILNEFALTEKDIATGVQCPHCRAIPMIPLKAFWKCSSYGTHSRDAHTQAVQDYFLLISPNLTNSRLRQFLHITSIQKARRLLTSMNLPYEGDKKARVYFQK